MNKDLADNMDIEYFSKMIQTDDAVVQGLNMEKIKGFKSLEGTPTDDS